jgi:hypothetical protein
LAARVTRLPDTGDPTAPNDDFVVVAPPVVIDHRLRR